MEPPNHFQTSAVCHGTLNPPLQEAQSSLAFRAYQASIRMQVPLAFPALGADQATLYIGAGGIGNNNKELTVMSDHRIPYYQQIGA
jgi:hypothetical protein